MSVLPPLAAPEHACEVLLVKARHSRFSWWVSALALGNGVLRRVIVLAVDVCGLFVVPANSGEKDNVKNRFWKVRDYL
jgi:hypothetical protein